MVNYKSMYLFIAICLAGNIVIALDIKPNILGPALVNRPFIVTWNVATEECKKFNVDLDLAKYDIVYNPDKSWKGDTLTIFYSQQLGLYPYFDSNGQPVNGGLPQLVDLNAHVDKVIKDINKAIPDKDFQGLAVIDWESWRPLFDRMTWGPFKIYHTKSIEKVKKEHPDWTPEQQVARAKLEYEVAAKTYFDLTFEIGKMWRPKALWGLYLYPDCYNYAKTGPNLTCSNQVIEMNDEIQWVFDDSTALYPSAYLGDWFKDNPNAINYVANRILETARVDNQRPGNVSIPMFIYHSITYRKELAFLDLTDLRNSIGVASILGSSGTVIWGDHYLANSTQQCQKLKVYLDNTFGPYCKDISDAATKCSNQYCNGHGRCVVSALSSEENKKSPFRYLTIPEVSELLSSMPYDFHTLYNRELFHNEKFLHQYSLTCQCFTGWSGKDCEISI